MRNITNIKSVPLFRELPSTVLEAYLSQCSHRTYKKKTVAFNIAENPGYICLLLNGRVRVYLSYPNGKEFTLTVLEPGDIYSGHTRALCSALEDSEVALIPFQTFKTILAETPAFSLSVIKVLGDALKNSINVIENLAFRDVNERLLSYLLSIAEVKGVSTDNGLQIKFGLTHEEIATMIGSTRQTVSLFFNNLQKEGLLTVQKGKITIHDLAALKKLHYSN